MALESQDDEPDCGSESSVNDGPTENESIMAALRCGLEKQAQEGRQSQFEH